MRLTARLDQIQTTRTALIVIGGLAVIWWIIYSNIQPIADWFTFSLLGLARDSRLGESLNFFV